MNTNIRYKIITHKGVLRLLMMLLLLFINGNLFAIDFEVNGITYFTSALSNTSAKVTGKTNNYTGAIVIPESVSYQGNTYTVTTIDEDAFWHETDITSISLPKTITLIDDDAFQGCDNLETVYITSLESWLKIAFGDSGSSPLGGAHHLYIDGKEVHDIVIPEGRTVLDDYVFNGFLGLYSVTLPNSLKALGREFGGCSNLQLVVSKIDNPEKIGIEGDSYPFRGISPNAKLIVPKGTINSYLAIPKWRDYFYEIAEGGNNGSNTISFADANVKAICVANWDTNGDGELSEEEASTVTSIGRNFRKSSIKTFNELKYFTGLTSISSEAFEDCSLLSSIVLPSNVKTLGMQAFHRCSSLTDTGIIFNGIIEEIDQQAFAGCSKLSSFDVPNGVKVMDNYVFEDCIGLVSISIPSSVISIGSCFFSGCTNLEEIQVNNNDTYESPVGSNAIIEKSSNKLIAGCKKTIIPDGVKIIGAGAFRDNTSLKNINIPESVVSIAGDAFKNCLIENVYIKSIESWCNIPNAGNIFSSYHLFLNNQEIKNLSIPSSITQIGYRQFCRCLSLEHVNIPGNVKSIGNEVFANCTNLQSVTFNDGLESIGSSTFYGCDISEVTIPSTVTNISSTVFNGNKTLSFVDSKIMYPTEIHEEAFSGISDNAKLQVPKGTKSRYENYIGWKQYFSEIVEEPETYTLSIKSTGSGTVTYEGTTIKNSSRIFYVEEESSVTVTFSPDNGYRIKSVKVGNSDVTASVSDNRYIVSSIQNNTTVEVVFEAIAPTTYSLSISATGNGSASYNGMTIRGKTSSYTVNEGTSATIKFIPDNGYRIKSVKLNNTNVTSSISDNQYSIGNITANTTLEVEFEAIPITTYTLSIKATGNGSASYDGNTIRSKTSTFTVNEGTKVAISLTPDNGYRIKSIKEDNTIVTSYISNGAYTINSINRNTNVEVEFEAIPPTTYTLSIKATGNGSASYDGTIIRGKTSSFTVNEGTSATIKFTLDNGYRLKSVKLNSTNVTSSVYDNQYTISNINANTTLEVEFEVIPIPTYTLTIKATGNGSASYNGTTIRENTSSYTVNEGTKISISLTPDNGYRIKRVKENGTNLTSYISNGTYTINSISRNTNIEVEFEAIPPTTYTLSIKATGNGSASYDGTTIRGKTSSFSINEGTSATIKFTPDNGYRIKSVKLNNTDVTSGVSDNQYTISNITANATLEVEFEAIPVPTYTLSITTTGNGSSTYDGIEIRNRMTSFTVNEGTNATITFSPDNGNSIASVKLNNSDVTSQVSGNRYTINNITDNTTLIVTFQEDVKALKVDGVNYTVVSQADRTVKVTGGDFGQVLTVPATVAQNGKTWTVTGIDTNALNGNTQLAAVIWNPEVAFTATVSNPNMLLYVKAEQYAPSAIKNVVVNGTASNIILTEAQSGNNFYCPQAFVAQKISYTHNYQMQTGLGESKGWETIALPFDVQTITHETKGTIVPFAQWNNDSNKKPFWLMELTGSGFVEAGSIKAYTPYIISMPNHPQYESQWLLNGKVTFASSSVTAGKTEHLNQSVYNGRTFVPCFAEEKADEGLYALNVSNDWETNKSGMTEGSKFVLNMRQVHPFEAYMTSSSNAAQYFDVFDDMTTGIHQMVDGKWMMEKTVYDLQGRKVENPSKKGVYIVNGKKMIIK